MLFAVPYIGNVRDISYGCANVMTFTITHLHWVLLKQHLLNQLKTPSKEREAS